MSSGDAVATIRYLLLILQIFTTDIYCVPQALATEGASPNMSSGDEVATITRSMSSALMPASLIAACPALIASSRSVSEPLSTCLQHTSAYVSTP